MPDRLVNWSSPSVAPVSESTHLWVWADPGVMEAEELPRSQRPAMTLWSAFVVMEMVWAAEDPLETKAWDPMGCTA